MVTHNKKARTLNLATPGVWRNPALLEEIKPTLMREHHNFIFQCYLQSPNFRVERKSSMLYMSVRKVPPSYDYGKYMQDILNKQRD